MESIDVSVIIPTFNEKENIASLVTQAESTLGGVYPAHEILVIDDCSPDGTGMIVENLSKTMSSVHLISRRRRAGIGSAVQYGFLKSRGRIIVTMDADLSHPPEMLPKLVGAAEKYPVVVGSRYACGGLMVAPLKRLLLSRFLNTLLGLLLRLGISDYTGGFMAVKREVLQGIGPIRSRSGDFSFEILYKAHVVGYRATEIPFRYSWRTNGVPKTKIVGFGSTYLLSALRLIL